MSFRRLACIRPDQLGSDDMPSISERLSVLRARRDKITKTWKSYFAWFNTELTDIKEEIEELRLIEVLREIEELTTPRDFQDPPPYYQDPRDYQDLITWLEEKKYLEQKGDQFNLFTDIKKTTQIQLRSKLEVANKIKEIGFGRLDSIYDLYIRPKISQTGEVNLVTDIRYGDDGLFVQDQRRINDLISGGAQRVDWMGRPIMNSEISERSLQFTDGLVEAEEQRVASIRASTTQQGESASSLTPVNPFDDFTNVLANDDVLLSQAMSITGLT
tara:strand:+ start:1458 stop:2276 length:819 start_codon:yes stop_codon:yes gene_type:complete